jgi:hypothetical protein
MKRKAYVNDAPSVSPKVPPEVPQEVPPEGAGDEKPGGPSVNIKESTHCFMRMLAREVVLRLKEEQTGASRLSGSPKRKSGRRPHGGTPHGQ